LGGNQEDCDLRKKLQGAKGFARIRSAL